MAYDVTAKVVLITGAANGIGAALARELHGRGAAVALLDVDVEAGGGVAADLGPGRALFLSADVRDRAAMARAVDDVVERFGRLDVVVANAGVVPPLATLRTVDPDAFDQVIAVNQTGTFNTVRSALEHVIDQRGHVVVVSSVTAFVPGVGGAAYTISKAAVEQLGRALRLELSIHGVTAGVAYFGFVDTDLTRRALDEDPLGRRLNQLLLRPLRRRITAHQAATVIADGIARRAARTMAPTAWQPYALLRGVLNIVVDRLAVGDRRLHTLLRELEHRGLSERV